MENLEKLKTQFKALFDAATDKEDISALSSINDTIESIEADTEALKKENLDLLNDYKEVVKIGGIFNSKEPEARGQQEAPSLEDFLAKAAQESK